ncbi:hypothetical protein DL766_008179 [Monosporascus sp. MC13-8B]|uniref:Uncharacterized protein n=1 Tax=Monosporascus cannonballus TaxID=155416 RepID=A0ABY0GVE0_9PEZI|nr:hypothetical protein DL762_010237 [Monosporascus cannonballus]RYO82865.1 hypothetical protein DL763_008097 [Monosporascus cannonballus]RYP20546.1 hypothetical protein DL766_008179 [Monosporascus sp. MC13-8B]
MLGSPTLRYATRTVTLTIAYKPTLMPGDVTYTLLGCYGEPSTGHAFGQEGQYAVPGELPAENVTIMTCFQGCADLKPPNGSLGRQGPGRKTVAAAVGGSMSGAFVLVALLFFCIRAYKRRKTEQDAHVSSMLDKQQEKEKADKEVIASFLRHKRSPPALVLNDSHRDVRLTVDGSLVPTTPALESGGGGARGRRPSAADDSLFHALMGRTQTRRDATGQSSGVEWRGFGHSTRSSVGTRGSIIHGIGHGGGGGGATPPPPEAHPHHHHHHQKRQQYNGGSGFYANSAASASTPSLSSLRSPHGYGYGDRTPLGGFAPTAPLPVRRLGVQQQGEEGSATASVLPPIAPGEALDRRWLRGTIYATATEGRDHNEGETGTQISPKSFTTVRTSILDSPTIGRWAQR